MKICIHFERFYFKRCKGWRRPTPRRIGIRLRRKKKQSASILSGFILNGTKSGADQKSTPCGCFFFAFFLLGVSAYAFVGRKSNLHPF